MRAIALGLLVASAMPAIALAQTTGAAVGAGARVELRAGYDDVSLELEASDGADSLSESAGESGVAYGVEAGYDFAVRGGVLLGAYVGAELSSVEQCAEVFGGDEGCISADRNLTAGVRLGAPLGQRAVAYIKGGYSNGGVEVEYGDASSSLQADDQFDGFHLGAGGEFNVRNNIYVKAEYVYTEYNGYEFSEPGFEASLDANRHQVIAGVGMRF